MNPILVTEEVAKAIEHLKGLTNGFHHEMYCKMNKYIFNQASDTFIPELEPLRKADLIGVAMAIRFGYTTNKNDVCENDTNENQALLVVYRDHAQGMEYEHGVRNGIEKALKLTNKKVRGINC